MISIAAVLAITAWVVVFLLMSIVRRSVQTLCSGCVIGWLFLPQFNVDLPGVTLVKLNVLALVSLIAALCVSPRERGRFRFRAVDLPVFCFCLAIFASSISNGRGAYDGFATAVALFLSWGVPWFVGRVGLTTEQGAMQMVRTVVAGSLLYVPFCVFEMKMAPVLHSIVYGYGPRGPESLRGLGMRFGMWRPTCFMETGLQLALFMAVGTVLALWMSFQDRNSHVLGVRTRSAFWVLALVTVLSVSTGATLLMFLGILLVLFGDYRAGKLVLLSLVLLIIAYPVFRMVSPPASDAHIVSNDSVLSERQASLNTRISQENQFIQKWWQRPWLGWTGWDYWPSESESIPDSLWIQILGKWGFLGWSTSTALIIFPLLRWTWYPMASGFRMNAAMVLSLAVTLYMLDCLLNAQENPIFVVMAGLISVLPHQQATTFQGNSPHVIGETLSRRKLPRRLWPFVADTAIRGQT